MPRVILQERHFKFLRELLEDHVQQRWALKPDVELAGEVMILLNYTRFVKFFTVEIQADNDDDE